MTVVRGLSRSDRRMLEDERRALRERLARVGEDPTMGMPEKAAERRALRERLGEIEEELTA